jgi:hypothetical protein
MCQRRRLPSENDDHAGLLAGLTRGVTLMLCLMPTPAMAVNLIKLTGPDDQLIEINPSQIVGLRTPRKGSDDHHFHASVKCLVFTADGKFNAVVESCTEVRTLLEEAGEGQ